MALQRQGQRDNEKVIGTLSEILNMPEDQIRKRIAANQNSYEPTRLKSNVSEIVNKNRRTQVGVTWSFVGITANPQLFV